MNIQHRFSKEVNQEPFLSEDDPPAFTLIKYNSPVIFTGPHNGIAVPSTLSPFLGMEEDWFLGAHESHDLYAAELFLTLQKLSPNANFLAGNYSRLVTDLNAISDASILSRSSEYRDTKILGNLNLSEQEMAMRIKNIHWPYHDALAGLIQETREQQNERALILDIHSFNPVWQGCPFNRGNVEISTIRSSKTPYSEAFEDFLKKDGAPFQFVSGHPYKVADRPNNAAHTIQSRNHIQYLGVEIRSDLIDTEEKRVKMAEYLLSALGHVMEQPNLEEITAPWVCKDTSDRPAQDMVQIWM